MSADILIIHHNETLGRALKRAFKQNGLSASETRFGVEGLHRALIGGADLVLLDMELEDVSGINILMKLDEDRRTSHLPVVCLSSATQEVIRIRAFELGAADYVMEPYSLRELVLRIQAILRRSPLNVEEPLLVSGPIRIDTIHYRVNVSNRIVRLTRREFRLLVALVRGQNRVLSRAELLDTVWGRTTEVRERTVDAYIKSLRAKLGPAARMIVTINRVGYCLRGDKSIYIESEEEDDEGRNRERLSRYRDVEKASQF